MPRPTILVGILITLALPTGSASARQCRETVWRRLELSEHYGALMVFDDAVGACIAFADQPWKWDGQQWQTFPVGNQIQPSSLTQLVYDSTRGEVLTFRLASPTSTLAWTPSSGWRTVATGSISAAGFAMVDDPDRDRVLLVQGATTLAWDGQAWSTVSAPGLTPHYFAALARDENRGRIVLYGGSDGQVNTAETWEFDGATWTRINAAGPVATTFSGGRYSLCTGPDGSVHLLDLAHEPLPRLWRWDGAAWTELPAPSFQPRLRASVALDRARSRLIVAGGQLNPQPGLPGGLGSDVWEWDGISWTRVHDPVAPRVGSAAMAYDTARDRTVLFGGNGATGLSAETWLHDGSRWTLSTAAGPSPRDNGAMAYDAARARVVLHGGVGAGNITLHDTWEWDGSSWTFISDQGPNSQGPVLAYDTDQQRCLLAPGDGSVWAWDGLNWAKLQNTGPVTASHCVAYDSARHVLVVDRVGMNTVAEWDGTQWRSIGTTFPWTLVDSAMAFDTVNNRCIRVGGTTLDAFVLPSSLIMEWDGHSWGGQGWPTWQMSPRSGPAIAWDSLRSRTFLHGGFGLLDTWVTSGTGINPPLFFSHPKNTSALIGQTITLTIQTEHSVNPGSPGPETYQWTRNGINIVDGPSAFGEFSGSATTTLTIRSVQKLATGQYRAIATNACRSTTSEPGYLNVTGCPGDLSTTAIPGSPGYGTPNGVRNNDDFFYYIAQFAAGNLSVADLTTTGAPFPGPPNHGVPDGILDADDFLTFLYRFQSPC